MNWKSFLTLLAILSLVIVSCAKEEKLYWVSSPTDYHVLTDVHAPFISSGNEALKVMTKEEYYSAIHFDIAELATLNESEHFILKVFYVTKYGEHNGSALDLRTLDLNGKLIDKLNFSNWSNFNQQEFCESSVHKDLSIEKNCSGKIERWRINVKGEFEIEKF